MKLIIFILSLFALFISPLHAEEAAGISLAKDIDISWLIICGALVFFMQAGFLMLEAGLVRSKNTINVASKNLIDFIIGSLGYLVVGFGIMFGLSQSGIIGTSFFFLKGYDTPNQLSFFFFQVTFMATAATIVSGAVAERISFLGYLIVSLVISIIIYPIFGHWSWGGGWLGQRGFADFAGSTVVHSIGGWVALAGAIVLGPRKGRFTADGKSNKIYGHNLPNAVLGTMILWLGWVGFNGGSTLALNDQVPGIVVNTFVAASSGGAVALFLSWLLFTRKASIEDTINGTLSGLVAITAGCNVVSVQSSLIIGAVAGILVVFASRALEKAKIDDVVGAFPVHGVNGMWGTLATALFVADPASGITVSVQLLGIAAAGLWAFLAGLVLFLLLKVFIQIRVSERDEEIGLNIAEHGAKTSILEFMNELSGLLHSKDFRQKLNIEHETEAGTMGVLLNDFLCNFSKIVSIIKRSALDLSYNSDSLNMLAKGLTTDAVKQTQMIDEFNTFLRDMVISLSEVEKKSLLQSEKVDSATEMSEKLSSGFKNLKLNLTKSNNLTDLLVELIKQNEDELLTTASNIRKMHVSTEKVQEMVKNIGEISDQLNMLGINASIEAARSGQSGHGFAIVANEISKLSDIATKNTSQASKYLADITRSVNEEINDINATVESFKKIYQNITNLDETVNKVTESSNVFSNELDSLVSFYDFIKQTSFDVISKMKESISVVDTVTESMRKIDENSDDMRKQVHLLEETSSHLQVKSVELKELISEFQVPEDREGEPSEGFLVLN